VSAISKAIPQPFTALIAEETMANVSQGILAKSSGVRSVISRRASQWVLNQDFALPPGGMYIELFDNTANLLKTRIGELQELMARLRCGSMLKWFLYGLDTSLMSLIVLRGAKPVKRTRLVPLLHFFEDVLNEVNEHLIERGFDGFAKEMWAPSTYDMIASIDGEAGPPIESDCREADVTSAICNDRLTAPQNGNQIAAKWAKGQRRRSVNRSLCHSINHQQFPGADIADPSH
jgi:hypothetical protein